MADIYARLKTTPNGPGPQHKVEGKTEFEFTEGKDGKLNVRDVDVKADLELIKQHQQQILQRLDSPIKTQLTGSIVEEIDITNEVGEIAAGAYKIYTLPEKYKGRFNAITVLSRRMSGSLSGIEIIHRTSFNEYHVNYVNEELDLLKGSTIFDITKRKELLGSYFSLKLICDDNADYTPRSIVLTLWR